MPTYPVACGWARSSAVPRSSGRERQEVADLRISAPASTASPPRWAHDAWGELRKRLGAEVVSAAGLHGRQAYD